MTLLTKFWHLKNARANTVVIPEPAVEVQPGIYTTAAPRPGLDRRRTGPIRRGER